jgi:hypothetical protein
MAGLSAMRQAGDGLRAAAVWGAWGSQRAVVEPPQGFALRGTSDAKLSYEPRQRGGWQLKHLRATRDSESVFSMAPVVVSYRL